MHEPSVEAPAPAASVADALDHVLSALPGPLGEQAVQLLARHLGVSVGARASISATRDQLRLALTHLASPHQLAEFIRNESRGLIGQADGVRRTKDPVAWYLAPAKKASPASPRAAKLFEQAIVLAYVANGLDEISSFERASATRRRSR